MQTASVSCCICGIYLVLVAEKSGERKEEERKEEEKKKRGKRIKGTKRNKRGERDAKGSK